MDAIAPIYMISIGIALIGLEAMLYSFVVIWFGLGFLSIGIILYFLPIESLSLQVELIATLITSLIFLFILRKPIVSKFLGKPDKDKDFLNERGFGIIIEGKLSYKGTFFNIDYPELYKEKERVEVINIYMNNAVISKIHKD